MSTEPFAPSGSTVKVAATTSSGATAITSCRTIRVHNAGTTLAFVNWASSAAVAAAASSIPVPAGAVEVFAVNRDVASVAAILASGTGDVYFTPGDGM